MMIRDLLLDELEQHEASMIQWMSWPWLITHGVFTDEDLAMIGRSLREPDGP